jgi:hypothetical protein
MTVKSPLEKVKSVLVVEADLLDRMNETDALIAQHAYEIYQSRGGRPGRPRSPRQWSESGGRA